ncbi:MAG: type II toxin-antitoxin system VapC family toxin [Candidatus Palauibacterales bacterium]|nr:type II toxin-antitoxin system VapC family toxin [Candidatus Palauibacterales bacterium]
MNVVDSSAWLAYLRDEPNAERFAPAIEETPSLLVPSIVVLEVYHYLRRAAGTETAIRAIAPLTAGEVVDLTPELAILAGELGHRHGLPVAASVILATARRFQATLWTQDADFEGLEDVEYSPRSQ